MTTGTQRPAEIVLGAESRKLRRDLAAAKGEIRGFGKDAAGTIRSSLGTAFAGAFSLASLGGATAVVKDVVSNERALTRLGIQADVSDDRVRQLATSMGQVSDDTGQFTSELTAGATQIVTLTGDFKLAAGSMRQLGVAATGTGATMEDLSGVVASLSQNLGIKPGLPMGEALDALTVQGKQGKIELKELASLLPSATAQFTLFGEKGMEAVTTLGAGLQVVAKATGTASEAATAWNALGKSYVANAARLKKLANVNVFRKDKKTGKLVAKDFVEITDALRKSKVGGNATKLIEALGTEEAFKAFNALTMNWTEFQEHIAAGLQGGGTIEQDFKRYLQSPAGRIERAWTRAQNAMQRAVTPERVEMIASATEAFAQALGFVVDNAQKVVTLIGAAKLAQLSLATHKWAQALGGVNAQAAGVSDKLAGAGAQVRSLPSGIGRVGSALTRAASAATGLVSAFTTSYEATSLLVDALGIFQDKTLTKTSADDVHGKAYDAQTILNEQDEEIAKLERAREWRRGEIRARGADPEKVKDATLEDLDRRLANEREARLGKRANVLATTISERDAARGTDALDNIIESMRAKHAIEAGLGRGLGRRGNTANVPKVDEEVLRQYAPEALTMSGTELARVVTLLEQQLREQERLRALQERVSQPRSSDTGPAAMSAPRTGVLPQ